MEEKEKRSNAPDDEAASALAVALQLPALPRLQIHRHFSCSSSELTSLFPRSESSSVTNKWTAPCPEFAVASINQQPGTAISSQNNNWWPKEERRRSGRRAIRKLKMAEQTV